MDVAYCLEEVVAEDTGMDTQHMAQGDGVVVEDHVDREGNLHMEEGNAVVVNRLAPPSFHLHDLLLGHEQASLAY